MVARYHGRTSFSNIGEGGLIGVLHMCSLRRTELSLWSDDWVADTTMQLRPEKISIACSASRFSFTLCVRGFYELVAFTKTIRGE
jgi:hypothetical protein